MTDPRHDFERAVQSDMGYQDHDFTRMENGEYKNLRVQFLWQGWRLAHECDKAEGGDVPLHSWDTHPYEPEQEDPLL